MLFFSWYNIIVWFNHIRGWVKRVHKSPFSLLFVWPVFLKTFSEKRISFWSQKENNRKENFNISHFTQIFLRTNGLPSSTISCFKTNQLPAETFFIVTFYIPRTVWYSVCLGPDLFLSSSTFSCVQRKETEVHIFEKSEPNLKQKHLNSYRREIPDKESEIEDWKYFHFK